jgi:thiamine kinase-like enzyme
VPDRMDCPTDIFALSVDDRLDLVPILAGVPRRLEPLPGGLTNTNCKISTSGGTYVARLSRPSSDLLAIDRYAEYRNSVAAADTGIAPKVVDFVPAAGLLLIDWIEGRTLEPADLRREEQLRLVAESCRILHAGRRFASDFDMFEIRNRYLKTVLDRGFRLPDRYLEFTAQWNRIRTVLAMDPPDTVPCHNDLLAANLIDDGQKLWLIDYEYSGNNDPCFELGNIWSESTLAEDLLPILVDAYYGAHRPERIARARLQALVSQYGWTLWGVIQNSVAEIEFDFWGWAMEKYERAVSTFDSRRFDDLLTSAAAGQATGSTTHRPEGETL